MSLHELRPYQAEAVEAVQGYLASKPGNPCVVLPTGSGKTHVIAALIEWTVSWGGRVLVLSHVKELLEQTHAKTLAHCPGLDVGLFSAGLGRRDKTSQVIVAGIQSVAKHACNLGPFNLILIDEAHLIPPSGEGRYRTFLNGARAVNPKVRIVGLTATPYRTTTGLICGPEHVLTEVCYEADIKSLIADGYLCGLKTRGSNHAVETRGLHVRQGEFVEAEVEELFTADDLVPKITGEIIERTRDRSGVLIFAASVKHGRLLEDEFRSHGCEVAAVYGSTPKVERAGIIERFRAGGIKYLVNRDVLTTGFDATHIDCVALLRCTLSPGLYSQMVGRGFRIDPRKADCLILDYGQNVRRHGPVDAIEPKARTGQKRQRGDEELVKRCPNCDSLVHPAVRECPDCGHQFPPPQKKHAAEAESQGILSGQVTVTRHEVATVRFSLHRKPSTDDNPDPLPTLRVSYAIATGWVSEWICIEHDGWAGAKAYRWWKDRSTTGFPDSVAEAVELASRGALAKTEWIQLKQVSGEKYPRITGYGLGPKPDPVTVPSETNEEEIEF